jgi:hypothetical protein
VVLLFLFYLQEEMHENPLKMVSKFMIVVWIIDLALKYLWQDIPTQNIKRFSP